MDKQLCFKGSNNFDELGKYLKDNSIKKIMLICGKSFNSLQINEHLVKIGIPILKYNQFMPNPDYADALKGAKIFNNSKCDCILAVGGGSSIDVAKAIKFYGNKKNVLLGAIPTTAGSGSEVTKFIVLYKDDKKQSIEDISLIPQFVLYEPRVLETLSTYQRKATFLDALSHAVESMWSLHASEQSNIYASQAIKVILDNYKDYLKNKNSGNECMLYAARLAGKAINITRTTACHAMSYKLVKMYGIAHGHAVGLCIPKVLEYTYQNSSKCSKKNNKMQLELILNNLAYSFNLKSVDLLVNWFEDLLCKLSLERIRDAKNEDLKELIHDINVERLENHPVYLDTQDLITLYKQILRV